MRVTFFLVFQRLFVFLALILFFAKGNIEANTIFVGPPPASIQSAINSAADGDTIQLSAGTYVQEVQVISKNLNIVGVGRDLTIIQAPGPGTHLSQFFTFGFNTYCIVMVDNQAAPTPQVVNISDLTVDGDSQQDTVIPPIYSSGNKFFAIGYHNASGTIENVHTTNTRSTTPANFGALAGAGISNASNTGTVVFNVNNCLIDLYQRIGIDCRGAALTANVTNTTINRGYFLPAGITTPNGMQYSSNTVGTIVNNTIEGNIATQPDAGNGIIIFNSVPNVLISENTLRNNDFGLSAITAISDMTISNNLVEFTTTPGINPIVGINLEIVSGLTILDSNKLNNLANVNMVLTSDTNQPFQLQNNQFLGSQTGLLVQGNLATTFDFVNFQAEDPVIPIVPTGTAQGPIVTMDSDSFVGTSGYYIQENGAPNDIWPSTATVSFDGLVSGHMTFAEFNAVLTKIYDKHNDPTLGLVLDFIPPITPTPPSNFIGVIEKNKFLNRTELVLKATWSASPSIDVVSYRIYSGNKLIAEIPASSVFIFLKKICSKSSASEFSISAVSRIGLESPRVGITIRKSDDK